MGMDLITAAFAKRKDTKLDFAAATGFVKAAPMGPILESGRLGEHLPYEIEGSPGEEGAREVLLSDIDEEEAREVLLSAIEDLHMSWTQGWRDQEQFEFGDWTIWIAGGSSWGDTPGPTFDAMTIVAAVPEVYRLIGFDWPHGSEEHS